MAAVVAKTAAAVVKSEVKAEQAEEAEGADAEARQRRTFLEVVLGSAEVGVSKPVVKAGSREVHEAEEKVKTIKAAIVSLGSNAAVADYRTQMQSDLVVAEAAVAEATVAEASVSVSRSR